MTEATETSMDAQTLYGVGVALICAGMLIVLAAFLSFFFANVKAKKEGKSGGVIIVGPIPIIFGIDKESLRTVLLLSLVLTIVVVIAMVLFHLMIR